MNHIKLFLILCLIPILSNCAINSRTASLKDAMEKSSSKNHGSRKVKGCVGKNNYFDDDFNTQNVEKKEGSKKNSAKPISLIDSTYSSMCAFRFGSGFLSSDKFYGLNHFSILKGSYSKKKRDVLLFNFGFEYSPIQQTNDIANSISGGVSEFFIGGEHRKYLNPSYTFLGNYIQTGGNLCYMFWNYQNEIAVDEYDEYGNLTVKKVGNDGLFGLDLFFGTGVDISQKNRRHLAFEITPGIKLWFPITSQGFKNDYFSPYFYLKVGIVFDIMKNSKK